MGRRANPSMRRALFLSVLLLSMPLSGCLSEGKNDEDEGMNGPYPSIWDRHELDWNWSSSISYVLEPGPYTIVASGYGPGEPNGNVGTPGMSLTEDPIITFVGGGRFGNDTVAFPGTPDGGPVNRYAAGTFAFEILSSPLQFTDVSYDSVNGETTLTWSSVPNRTYAIDESIDLITWDELDDSLESAYFGEDVQEAACSMHNLDRRTPNA